MKMLTKSSVFIFIICLWISGCKPQEEENTIPQKIQTPPQQEDKLEIVKQANLDPKVEQEIIAVIRENIEASKAKDVNRVLATVHEDSPQLNSTKEGMDFVFKNYSLDYVLEQVEVIEIEGDNAKVFYVQFTTNKGPQQFADNRAAGFHIMKKSYGKWKIYKTEPVK